MGTTIILVDDEGELLEVLADQLSTRFDSVLPCPNGATALETLRTTDVDMLVTDYRMPGMNGLALLNEARRLKPWLPILILTGNDHEPDLLRALPSGGFDFLEKPFRFEVLVSRMQNGLRFGKILRLAWDQLKTARPSEAERIQAMPGHEMSTVLTTAMIDSMSK